MKTESCQENIHSRRSLSPLRVAGAGALILFAAAMILMATLAIPERLAASSSAARYMLIDIGTFGGPASYLTNPGNGLGFSVLNSAGTLVGRASTSTPDPSCASPDCFLDHAFRWEHGVLTDLGTLPGGNFSDVGSVNAQGWIAIDGTNGTINPLTGGPVTRGALLKNGQLIDIGTLGGLENIASYVNDAGQVIGVSSINTTPDPFSFLGASGHPFIWQNGVMQDLGTLGGPDASVGGSCGHPPTGLVTGSSLINSTPNPDTGIPTSHPFLWANGTMIDLGTLGGTLTGNDKGVGAQCVNQWSQVAGTSFLAGNSTFHAFLWNHGVMHDLGTLGGDNSKAQWINGAGEIVGTADLPGSQTHHAFLWKNGVMTDLGTLGGTSLAVAINSNGQVVGQSRPIGSSQQHAFLWENGGPMVDLNTLIPPNSSLLLVRAENINDLGEIAGRGLPPGCTDIDACGHVFLLIPVGQ